MNQRQGICLATVVVFLLCFYAGHWFSQKKEFWGDELFSWAFSVEYEVKPFVDELTYLELLKRPFLLPTSEGNNSPLYYLLQKIILDIYGESVADLRKCYAWNAQQESKSEYARLFGDTNVSLLEIKNYIVSSGEALPALSRCFGGRAQFVQRILSIFAISLVVAFSFWFFATVYSFVWGSVSFFISGTTLMYWLHIAESRPYALWMCLSGIQFCLFLAFYRTEWSKQRLGRALLVIHYLLAFLSSFAMIQISLTSALLWLSGNRRRDWLHYALLFLLPSVICVAYHSFTPNFVFGFSEHPIHLILANFSIERIALLLAYMTLGLSIYFSVLRKQEHTFSQDVFPFVALVVLHFLAVAAVMFLFYIRETTGVIGQGGIFAVSNRYFSVLAPLSAIASTVVARELWVFRGDWLWRIPLLIGLLTMGAYRLFKILKVVS